MTEVEGCLIRLLRSVLCDAPLGADFSLAQPEQLLRLAKRQDLAHLAAFALSRAGLLDAGVVIGRRFERDQMLALWRVANLEQDYVLVASALEKEGVDYLPLKGTVLRRLYPEPWMRTSADIDLLVHADDLRAAERALADNAGFRVTSEGEKEDHVTSPSGFHVDLHFTLSEQKTRAAALLAEVWDRALPVSPGSREHQMPDEMFYLYHMFHAAEHFSTGSCGVRSVMDTWLLNHAVDFDRDARQDLLERAGLLRFSGQMEALAETWFSGAPEGDTAALGTFIMRCGLYGGGLGVAALQAQAGGRAAYVLRRAFPPYDRLKHRYPVLERHPVLLPLMWLRRLGEELLCARGATARAELRRSDETAAYASELTALFQQMGVNAYARGDADKGVFS